MADSIEEKDDTVGAGGEAGDVEAAPVPSEEMVKFFETRTAAHVAAVTQHMVAMAGYNGLSDRVLLERAEEHDRSKWEEPERIGYIFHSWVHRCARVEEEYSPSSAVQAQIDAAIEHHLSTNSHHIEAHGSPDDMSSIDIVEMACDLTAISRENGASTADAWVTKNIHSFGFSPMKEAELLAALEELNTRLAAKSAT